MKLGVYSRYETARLGITNSWSRGEQMGKGSHAIYHQQNSVFNEIEGLMTSRNEKALDAKMCNLGHGQHYGNTGCQVSKQVICKQNEEKWYITNHRK